VREGGLERRKRERGGGRSGSTLFLTGLSIHVRAQTRARTFCSAKHFGRGKHLGGPRPKGYSV